MKIAKEYLLTDTVLTETFSYSSFVETDPIFASCTSYSCNHLKKEEQMLNYFNMKKMNIDKAACGSHVLETVAECSHNPYPTVAQGKASTTEGVQARNKVMADLIKEPGVVIVGANHLYGLMEETDLKQRFEVLAINVDPTEHYDQGYPSEAACYRSYTRSFYSTEKPKEYCYGQYSDHVLIPPNLNIQRSIEAVEFESILDKINSLPMKNNGCRA